MPDKENTQYFTGTKIFGGDKIAQGNARLQFFVAQTARTGQFAFTILLGDGKPAIHIYLFLISLLITKTFKYLVKNIIRFL